MRRSRSLLLALLAVPGCAATATNPDFCDEATPCASGRVCDLEHAECHDPDPTPDAGAPSLEVAQLDTRVLDERADDIAFPAEGTSGVAHHVHHASVEHPVTILSSGDACPHVYKHAYLLAASPAATEEVANALGGEGGLALSIDGRGVRALVTLHRDEVAPLGQLDGRFEVELEAVDSDGASGRATACFELDRLPVPLAIRPTRKPTTLPLVDLDLGGGSVSAVINGVAPARGIASFRVENLSHDPAFVRVTPVALTASECRRSHRRASVVTGVDLVTTPCLLGPPATCPTSHPLSAVQVEDEACDASPLASEVVVETPVGQAIGPCPGCAPDVYAIGGAAGEPGRLEVTVRLARAAGLRPYANDLPPGTTDEENLDYRDSESSTIPRHLVITGHVERAYNRCLQFTTDVPSRCARMAHYELFDALSELRLVLTGDVATVESQLAGDQASDAARRVALAGPVIWATSQPMPPLQP